MLIIHDLEGFYVFISNSLQGVNFIYVKSVVRCNFTLCVILLLSFLVGKLGISDLTPL